MRRNASCVVDSNYPWAWLKWKVNEEMGEKVQPRSTYPGVLQLGNRANFSLIALKSWPRGRGSSARCPCNRDRDRSVLRELPYSGVYLPDRSLFYPSSQNFFLFKRYIPHIDQDKFQFSRKFGWQKWRKRKSWVIILFDPHIAMISNWSRDFNFQGNLKEKKSSWRSWVII